jgi:hypothetical protein
MEPDDDARVFGGTPEGEARGAEFEGPPDQPERSGTDESRT